MKRITVVFIWLITFNAFSQEHLVYLELGGAGPMVSMNYERQLTTKPMLNLRAGLGYVVTWDYEGFTLPTGLYYLSDLNKGNHLELGINYTFLFDNDQDDIGGFFLPAIGYRKYYPGKKSFFKITFNPVFFNNDPVEVLPWGGVSFGKRF